MSGNFHLTAGNLGPFHLGAIFPVAIHLTVVAIHVTVGIDQLAELWRLGESFGQDEHLGGGHQDPSILLLFCVRVAGTSLPLPQ